LKRFKHILKQKEEIMLQLNRFQKIILGSLLVFAIVLSCQEKTTPPVTETTIDAASMTTGMGVYDQSPEPVEGFVAIQKKMIYPEIQRQAGIEGKVFVKLLITEQGDIETAEIIKSANPAMDSAAIHALTGLKWKPARKQEQPVKVSIVVPVVFTLTAEKNPPAQSVDHSIPQPVGGMAAIAAQIRYPDVARRAGITGEVHLQLLIDEQGKIEKTEIVKSMGKDNGLDEAALDAVRKVTWQPALKDGKPFKTAITVPIRFNLK
jgi:TonB family protein